MTKYFGTNGARGTFKQLTPEIALRIAQAVGIYFKRGRIIVARDMRLTSDVLWHAVVSGLLSVGCDVVDLGMVSSPTAEFMLKKMKADGLIIITASHNPPEYNGIKVVDGAGVAVSRERAEEIERLMERPQHAEWDKIGKLTHYERAIEDHIDAIARHINVEKIRKKKPRLVLDCGNGMASLIAPRLFKKLGCDVILLNSDVDGHFPGRPSEPTAENVREMLSLVREEKADAGIAWDGDADRVAFSDERGEYVIGDKVFALSVFLKLKERKGNVVSTVATSLAIEEIAKAYGSKVIYTKIGAPYLSEKIAKGNAVIAGEEVGGVIWPEISLAKEGLFTAARIVEAICEKPLSEWLREIPDYKNIKEKIPADEKMKKAIVERVKKYAKENNLSFIDIDGVRINLEDGWVIVRASGTENYVRIFAEAKTEKRAREILDKYKSVIGVSNP